MSGRVKILFRADASQEIGAGHVMRCVSLAQAFNAREFEPVFWTRTTHQAFLKRMEREGFKHVSISSDVPMEEEPAIMRGADFDGFTGIFVDRYELPGNYFSRVRQARPEWTIASFDDWGRPINGVDLILNQNMSGNVADYAPVVSAGTCVLAGPRYGLIRSEYRRHQPVADRARPVKNILITFGGADFVNATDRVLRALEPLDRSIVRHVVLGAAYNWVDEIARFAAGKPYVHVSRDLPDMVEAMERADISITGAGSTLMEIYYMGLPNVLYTLIDNQEANGRAARASVRMGNIENFDAARLLAEVQGLISSPAERLRMSRASREIVDGDGADRVCETFARMVQPASGAKRRKQPC